MVKYQIFTETKLSQVRSQCQAFINTARRAIIAKFMKFLGQFNNDKLL